MVESERESERGREGGREGGREIGSRGCGHCIIFLIFS